VNLLLTLVGFISVANNAVQFVFVNRFYFFADSMKLMCFEKMKSLLIRASLVLLTENMSCVFSSLHTFFDRFGGSCFAPVYTI